MSRDELSFWITIAEAACWVICFLWMHRISARQDGLLHELRGQAQRIEALSKVEHDLIKEVHPQVGDIKAGVEEVMAVVRHTPKNEQTA